MICSSVNLIRFIRPSLLKGRALNLRGGETQWQVTLAEGKSRSLQRRPEEKCPEIMLCHLQKID